MVDDERHIDILEGREFVDKPTFLSDDEWYDVDIDGNLLDVRKDIKRPRYTLSYNGVPFAPLGAIHALTGQKKNGKTMTETLLICAILKGEYGNLRYELAETHPNPTVLYIDTEMEEENSLMVARRVHHVMGWDYQTRNPRFTVLWLRDEVDAATRWKKTLKAVWQLRPTVVLLDGIRDVIGDFNDLEASSELVRKCMNIATEYNCSMWCILHENPGSDKMRGHLGTELGNKISDTFVSTKTKNSNGVYFTVSQRDARGKDVEDFKFVVSDESVLFGIPTLLTSEEATKAENDNLEEIASVMKEAIKPPHSKKYREIKDYIKKRLTIGNTKAEEMIRVSTELGIIRKHETGQFTFIGLNNDEKLPF